MRTNSWDSEQPANMYDDYYYDREEPRALKHSGLGIASFIITLGAGTLIFILVLIAGVLESSTPGGIDEDSPTTILLGLVMIGMMFVDVLGLVLGIIGLCLPNRNKIFAIIGVVLGALVAVGFLCILIVGMVAG